MRERHGTTARLAWAGLLGITLGITTFGLAARGEAARVEVRLVEHLDDRAGVYCGDLTRCLEELYALRALFYSSDFVRADEFATFSRELLKRSPAICSLYWLPTRDASSAAAERGKADLANPSFDSGVDARRYGHSVAFVEAIGGPGAPPGFAFGAEESCQRAMHAAAGSTAVHLTEPLTGIPGCPAECAMAFLAVFDREGRTLGFLAAGVELARLQRRAFGDEARVTPMARFTLDSNPLVPTALPVPEDSGGTAGVSKVMNIGGRSWRIRAAPSAAFLRRHRTLQPILIGSLAALLWTVLHASLLVQARRARLRVARRHERSLCAILHSLEEGVVLCDVAGHVMFKNESVERMLGKLADTRIEDWPDVYGIRPADEGPVFPPDQHPLSRALRGERVTLERIHVQNESQRGAWLSVSAIPLVEGFSPLPGAILVLRDITERLQTETTIRKFSAAVDQSADLVFVTDPDGRILYANAAFARHAERDGAHLSGAAPEELWRIRSIPPLASNWVDGVERAVTREQVWTSSSGDRCFMEESITPIVDSAQRLVAYVSVCRDMTGHKDRLRLLAEMEIAALVQARLYPGFPPNVSGIELAGCCFPAKETCGDYFDYLVLDDGRVVVVVGDISGHGLGAALLMAEVRTYLRSILPAKNFISGFCSQLQCAPSREGSSAEMAVTALKTLNRLLERDLPEGLFLTLCVAVIDPESHVMEYASAGHEPAIILGADGNVKHMAERTGVAVGLVPDLEIAAAPPIALEDGDTILFTTDGLTEIHSPDGELFGVEQIVRVAREHHERPAAEIVEELRRSAVAFHASDSLEDDLTIVCCKVRELPLPRQGSARAQVSASCELEAVVSASAYAGSRGS